ncbi:hypothetical protein ACH5RR_008802 [Cinchona calisaya]|uniref:Uncharacterized protein n=1 Tax=Cinchona calisaya TaxID=153742 RepID=A0ABD3AFZ6_9GENT
MKLFVIRSGGYKNVEFVANDLYKKMDVEIRKEIAMRDTEGVIGYLATKKDGDGIFFYKYCTYEMTRVKCDAFVNGFSVLLKQKSSIDKFDYIWGEMVFQKRAQVEGEYGHAMKAIEKEINSMRNKWNENGYEDDVLIVLATNLHDITRRRVQKGSKQVDATEGETDIKDDGPAADNDGDGFVMGNNLWTYGPTADDDDDGFLVGNILNYFDSVI